MSECVCLSEYVCVCALGCTKCFRCAETYVNQIIFHLGKPIENVDKCAQPVF